VFRLFGVYPAVVSAFCFPRFCFRCLGVSAFTPPSFLLSAFRVSAFAVSACRRIGVFLRRFVSFPVSDLPKTPILEVSTERRGSYRGAGCADVPRLGGSGVGAGGPSCVEWNVAMRPTCFELRTLNFELLRAVSRRKKPRAQKKKVSKRPLYGEMFVKPPVQGKLGEKFSHIPSRRRRRSLCPSQPSPGVGCAFSAAFS